MNEWLLGLLINALQVPLAAGRMVRALSFARKPNGGAGAEEKLKQSESLLRIAGRTALFGGWAVDLARGRVSWSDEVCAIHEMPAGYSPTVEEGIDFYAPEFRARIRDAYQACAANGTPYDLELQIVTATGRRVWVRAVGEAVREAGGAIVRVQGAFQDISRHREADEILQASAERFSLLSKATNDAIWDWDLTTNALWWSEGFQVLSGVGLDEVDPSIRSWTSRIHPDDEPRVMRSIHEVIAGRTAWSAEYRFRRRDGSYACVFDRGYVVRDEGGRPVRMIGGMSDITERKRTEEELRASGRRMTEILESITDSFMVLDLEWRFVYLNPQGAALLQRSREDLLGKSVWVEFPEAVGSAFYEQYHRAMREQVVVRFQEFYPPLDTWFQVTAYPSATGLSAYFSNITEHKRAEQAIQRYALRQGKLAAFGRLALASTDLDKLMREAAAAICEGLEVAFSKVLQITSDGQSLAIRAGSGWNAECTGRRVGGAGTGWRHRHALVSPEPVIVGDFARETRFTRSAVLAAHGIASAVEVLVGGVDGPWGWLGAYAREPNRFTHEDAVFLQSLANTLEAVLERRHAEERFVQLTQFDALTGLPNRHLFRDRLEQVLTQSRRAGRPAAAVLLDLDRFSAVNDALGHGIGDELLKRVAQRLQECVRTGDTVARLGGDEFAIALANLARVEDAGLVARKLIAALARPFDLNGQETYVTGSFGITVSPDDGDNPDVLLKNADTALYRAKEQGSNTYQYYLPQMNERAAERLRMETQLRGVLEREQLDEQFVLHYQPKVSAAAGRYTGVEALLRWNHPQEGLVSPARFIPLLEETGLIVEVGRWALERAAADYRAWESQGLDPPPIAVNVSLVQLRRAEFVESVRQVLERAGLSAAALHLEITESVIMQNIEEIVLKLSELKQMGVGIAIDDFGTGYSSLAYLAALPVDALKIDRAFIRDMGAGTDNMSVVSAIISLARSLKLNVIAEGVEQEGQARRLRSLQCDEMQGFLFSKPVPAGRMAALLRCAARAPRTPE